MAHHCSVCGLDLDEHTLEDLQKCELKEKLWDRKEV
jgi:hypothetical protein